MPVIRYCMAIDHMDWTRGNPASWVDATVRLARAVDSAGLDSIWLNEDPDGWDAFAVLGAMARETSRVRLGTGVTNVFHRYPNLLASSVATLDRLSNGRAFLGIGRGQPEVYERIFEMDTAEPLQRMATGLEQLRQWWAPPYAAEISQGSDAVTWRKSIGPVNPPPIYMAAVGPKALALAGNAADGVLFNALATPEFVRWAVDRVCQSAAEHDRNPKALSFFVNPATIITDNPEPILERKKAFIALVHALPGMERLLMTQDWDVEAILGQVRKAMRTSEVIEKGGLFVELREIGDLEAAKAAIPTGLIDHASAIGPLPVVRQKLAKFASAGATHIFIDRQGLAPDFGDLGDLVRELRT